MCKASVDTRVKIWPEQKVLWLHLLKIRYKWPNGHPELAEVQLFIFKRKKYHLYTKWPTFGFWPHKMCTI